MTIAPDHPSVGNARHEGPRNATALPSLSMPTAAAASGSPEWWRDRLYKRLTADQPWLAQLEDYYCGDHPLPWIPDRDDAALMRRMMRMSRTNYMGLVVDATAERMIVEGFRVGDQPAADPDVWAIWQANNLDADSDAAILDAVKLGRSCMLVAPAQPEPLVTVEHATQAVVAYTPGNRRIRAAGLKAWLDDWTGDVLATLYLPDLIFKWRRRGNAPWQPREVPGETWPARNVLAVVPLVDLPNNPGTLGGGRSEIADLLDIQDRINKTVCDRLMAQDYGAFPQKWATGWDVDEAEVRGGRKRIIVNEAAEGRFGQFDTAPLDPYSAAKAEDVQDIAARSRVPPQYLLGKMVNLPGEALKTAESGLVAKVRRRTRSLGEGLEEVARLMLRAAGRDVPASTRMGTIWRNPEFRTEGELVDALVKMSTLGVPRRALWERWGASQEEMDRWEVMQDAEVARAGLGDFAAQVTALP